jgi:hypothetical protein
MNSLLLLLSESTFVGFYSIVIAHFLSFFLLPTKKKISFVLFFFFLGFLKHGLGFLLGLQTWYCNEGEKCKEIHDKHDNTNDHETNKKWKAKQPSLLENLGEGILFLLFAWILTKIFTINNLYLTTFLVGFLLHIISEFSGFHAFFCNHRCIQR